MTREQNSARIGNLAQAAVGHGEHTEFVDRPETVLDGADHAVATVRLTFEIQRCVDHVLEFGEDTPEEVIRLIGPDVFAKGGDYTRETLPETPLVEALGGEVRILPYIDGASTTRVIEQIRSLEELRGTA